MSEPLSNIRPQMDVERAHDILAAVVRREAPCEEIALEPIWIALDVLCWVLQHGHNQMFATNMARIEEMLARNGFELKPTPGIVNCPNCSVLHDPAKEFDPKISPDSIYCDRCETWIKVK